MSFCWHTDVNEHPVFGQLGLTAFGLWIQAGIWTSANDSPGFVPGAAIKELADGPEMEATVRELVKTGAWTAVLGGFRMEYGPSADWPLPVWRYDAEPPANGFFEVLPDPN